MLQTAQLPNGVHVISQRFADRRSAALGVWLLNGVRHEHPHQAGYAHFLEHLLFKGCGALGATALARRFDAMGGQVNAYTGRELTALHGLVPADDAPELLELLTAMLLTPRFSEEDVRLERHVVSQEMAMVQDTPEEALEEQAVSRAWADHPLGRPILGTSDSIGSIDAANMRAYLRDMLSGGRLWVVAVGDVDHDAMLAGCSALGNLPTGTAPATTAPRFDNGAHSMRLDSEQCHLQWLLPTAGIHDPDYYALLLANQLLGGGSASRLFQQLRENLGLVYDIHTRLDLYSDAGLWLIQTACDPDHAHLCRQAVTDTLTGLLRDGIAAQEMEIARRHLIAGLYLEQDDPEATMERLAREAIYLDHHPDTAHRIAALHAVTPAQVTTVLAQRWTRHLHIHTG